MKVKGKSLNRDAEPSSDIYDFTTHMEDREEVKTETQPRDLCAGLRTREIDGQA